MRRLIASHLSCDEIAVDQCYLFLFGSLYFRCHGPTSKRITVLFRTSVDRWAADRLRHPWFEGGADRRADRLRGALTVGLTV